MMNKKGSLVEALNKLPQAVMLFVVFSIVLTIGLKFISSILASMPTPASGTSLMDNWTYNNISMLATTGFSQFTTNSGLIATITVMAVVLTLVIGAFSMNRR